MKRAMIVDDEQAAIIKLEKMLKESGAVEICGTFLDPSAAVDYARRKPVDIAFLDIEMPKISGIELADMLMDIKPDMHIVFVTAYSEYAVEAFRCHALDYLLKPVTKDRLKMSLDRIKDETIAKRTSSPIVKVKCFGRLSVTIDEMPIKFRTAKAEELLAFLISYNGKPVHRNHIMDLFWSDYDGDRALVLFNTTLHYLKKAFWQHGVKLNVIHQRGSYSLDMEGIECDAVKFEETVKELKYLTEQKIQKYEYAAELYDGNYLEHNDYDWANQNRLAMQELYESIVIKLARYYLKNEKSHTALKLLKNALHHTPLNKDINLLMLKTLAIHKDRVSFYRYFDMYKIRLKKELDALPDADFLKLAEKMR